MIGAAITNENSTGGVDFTYGLDNAHRTDLKQCDQRFLAMGDLIQTGPNNIIYGLQDSPAGPGGNVLPLSYFVDADGITTEMDKTQNGDVEVYRESCLTPTEPPIDTAILKICKVAGLGVTVGTPFNFTAPPNSTSVPAGPPPGGYCKVVGSNYTSGSSVTVQETIPSGHAVTNITCNPAASSTNLSAGTATVTMGPGVTECTYTDEKRTGYLEICKTGHVTGNFSFTLNPAAVNPAGPGPFVVPAGACSPAIEVPAGQITITEAPHAGTAMTNACSTIPASQQVSCNPGPRTSVVNVAAGDISSQTIAFITNAPKGPIGEQSTLDTPASGRVLAQTTSARVMAEAPAGARADGFAAKTALSCTPDPAPANRMLACTAKVTAVTAWRGTPTGMVSFSEGDKTLAVIPLDADGTATLAIPTLAPGDHALVATYKGDKTFRHSESRRFDARVEGQ